MLMGQREPNSKNRGGSRIFFRRGALVSCSTSTPINHIVFFLQNTSCMRKAQVISGKGAHPLHPPPRSVPAFGISVPLRGGIWIFSLQITLTKGRPQKEKRVLKFCRQSNRVIKNTNSNLRVSPFRVLIAY